MNRFVARTLVGWLLIATPALAAASPGGASSPRVSSVPAPTGGRSVDINQADLTTLEGLPGIGPGRARKIVEFRQQHPFRKVDELTRVRGIGRKTIARLRPMLTVSPSAAAERSPGGR